MSGLLIGGETFNVEVEGDAAAPALMLSNSLGTNLHMWDKQVPALTPHFRVVRYDSRGHGGSVAGDGPYTIEQLGRDALAILDALGIEKANWLGLSKGGMVGQWLLTHAPERIERAILANTAAHMSGADLWNSRIEAVLSNGMEAVTDAVIERWFTKGFREGHPEEVGPIVEMLHATPAAGYAGCCAAIRDMDQREAIRAVTNPVLVIVGRHDPSTPPGMGALIASAIKGAKLVTLEAAHLSNIEDPVNFESTIIDFLTTPRPEPVAPPEPATEAEEPAPPPPAAPPAPRAGPRKAAAKKAAPVKKAPRNKAPAKKTAVKKAASKKATKKVAAKKAVKKAAPKKPARKAAGKKASVKKASVKKAVKKMPVKKTAAKKAAPKKIAAKKIAAKKSSRKTVAKAARKGAKRRR